MEFFFFNLRFSLSFVDQVNNSIGFEENSSRPSHGTWGVLRPSIPASSSPEGACDMRALSCLSSFDMI